jgi:hypothetical protein
MTLHLAHAAIEALQRRGERYAAAHGERLFEESHSVRCCGMGRRGNTAQCAKQAANESWVQPLGYTAPDSRPLAADVSAAGHGYQSYIGAARAARGIHEHASQHSY